MVCKQPRIHLLIKKEIVTSLTILTVNSGIDGLCHRGHRDSLRDEVCAEQTAQVRILHILERVAAVIFVTAFFTFGGGGGLKPGMLQIYSLSLAREAISLIDVPHAHNVSLKLLEAWTAILRELELEVVPSLADQVAVRKVKYFSFTLEKRKVLFGKTTSRYDLVHNLISNFLSF